MWAFSCNSVFNNPLLDAGVGRGGGQGVLVNPGQAANVVQPVGVCRQGRTRSFEWKFSFLQLQRTQFQINCGLFFSLAVLKLLLITWTSRTISEGVRWRPAYFNGQKVKISKIVHTKEAICSARIIRKTSPFCWCKAKAPGLCCYAFSTTCVMRSVPDNILIVQVLTAECFNPGAEGILFTC